MSGPPVVGVVGADNKVVDAQSHADPPTFVGLLQPSCTDSALTRGDDHALILTASNFDKANDTLVAVDESEAFLRSIIEDDETTIFPSSSDESGGFRPGRQYDKMPMFDLQLKAQGLHQEFIVTPATSEGAPRKAREAAAELARLGPQGSHMARSQRMKRLRREAQELQLLDDRQRATLHANIQRVLDEAGPTGSHLAFLEHVLQQTRYEDKKDLLRDLQRGFPLYGVVPTGSAKPRLVRRATTTPSEVRKSAEVRWRQCLTACERARTDGEDSVLHDISEQTRSDQQAGRMGPPRELDRTQPCPTRRFGVRQLTSKGSWEIRCIDDFNASGINDCCHIIGRLRMGRITDLVDVTKILHEAHPGTQLVIFKTDFQAAYRGVPLRPQHHLYADVVYYDTTLQRLVVSRQFAMPFGAVAAVYGWDRVADALSHVLMVILAIPVVRYVDDLFGACFAVHAEELRDMILELMAMCGFTLDPQKTPLPAPTQTILGIECRLYSGYRRQQATYAYITARLDAAKTEVWIEMINGILLSGQLAQHDAEKLAGRLNFLTFSVAGRSGASRLSRLYTATYKPCSALSEGLRADLRWWLQFLSERRSKSYEINRPRDKIATLYTDAEGNGGIGGVIFLDDAEPLQFTYKVPISFNSLFTHRKTYIIQLELLAVTVGLTLFSESLKGATAKFFVDNRSVLGCLRKGRSKVEDLNNLVLLTVDRAIDVRLCLFSWIPSAYNIADPPSRGQMLPDVAHIKCDSAVESVISDLRASMHA